MSCFSADPIIVANPVKTVYEPGSNVTLTCSYAYPSEVQDYRYFKNDNLERTGGPQLILSNLQPSDSGIYTCDVAYQHNAGYSVRSINEVELNVAGKLTIFNLYLFNHHEKNIYYLSAVT